MTSLSRRSAWPPTSLTSLLVWMTTWTALPSLIAAFACYPAFSARHSGCVQQRSSCPPLLVSGVSVSDRKLILDLHNKIRANATRGVGNFPPAADMLEMEWDDELAVVAQGWAEQCILGTDCADCRRVGRFQVGQNVYFYQHLPDDGAGANWSMVIGAWATQERNLVQGSAKAMQKYEHSDSYALYTQLVWASSFLVGCGFVKYSTQISNAHFGYVCNYGPAGNVFGHPVYGAGEPCTRCPTGFGICVHGALCGRQEVVSAAGSFTGVTSEASFHATPAHQIGTEAQQLEPAPTTGHSCAGRCIPLSQSDTCVETSFDIRADFAAVTCGHPDYFCCLHVRVDSTAAIGTTTPNVLSAVTHPPDEVPSSEQFSGAAKIVPRKVCGGEFICVGDDFMTERCDLVLLLTDLNFERRPGFGECPVGSNCCIPREVSPPCPNSHACLPKVLARLWCVPGSVLSQVSDCGGSGRSKICCMLSTSNLAPASTTPIPRVQTNEDSNTAAVSMSVDSHGHMAACQDDCVTGDTAKLCQLNNLVMKDATCEGENMLCCRFQPEVTQHVVGLTGGHRVQTQPLLDVDPAGSGMLGRPGTVSPSAASLTCHGHGRCMATYLRSECEAKPGYTLSDVFSCNDPRLLCCAESSAVVEKQEELSGKDSPDADVLVKSPVTGTRCGKTQATFRSRVDPCWLVDVVDGNGTLLCHGALIDTQFVSTTASCMIGENADTLLVALPWERDPHKASKISANLAPWEYSEQTLDSDLRVFKLADPVDLESTGACVLCIATSREEGLPYTLLSAHTDKMFLRPKNHGKCPIGETRSVDELQKAAQAGDLARVKLLIEVCGANPNGFKASSGSNVLHEAAFHGSTQVASYLIEAGVDPDTPKQDGWAPVHLAVVGKNPVAMLKLLASKGADMQLKTHTGNPLTAAQIAAAGNPLSESTKYLDGLALEGNGSQQPCPTKEKEVAELRSAAGAGNLPGIRRLVEQCRVDLNQTLSPDGGNNALHEAAYNGQMRVASHLIDAGVDPNAPNKDGWAAVHLAVVGAEDPLPMLKLLASKGADMRLTTRTTAAQTAEDIARQLKPGSEALEFLEFFSQQNKVDGDFGRMSASQATVEASSALCKRDRLFDENFGPKNSICVGVTHAWCGGRGSVLVFKRGKTQYLAGHLSFPSNKCFQSGAAAVFADASNKWAVDFIRNTVRALVDVGGPKPGSPPKGEEGAERNATVFGGARWCPSTEDEIPNLHNAVKKGDLLAVKRLAEQCKVDLNQLSSDLGSNALHEAAFHGQVQVASYLIDAGVDPNAPKKDGWAAVHLAVIGLVDPIPMLKLLASKGADLRLRTRTKEAETPADVAQRLRSGAGVGKFLQALLKPGGSVVNLNNSVEGCPPLNGISKGYFRIVACSDFSIPGIVPLSDAVNATECFLDGIGRYKVGSRVNYDCSDFHVLRGDAWRTCQRDGNWNGDEPLCEAECGKRYLSTELTTRGTRAKGGEWPWVAALYLMSMKDVVCGGALIKETWVMTAAHCVVADFKTKEMVSIQDLIIYLGKHYRAVELDGEEVQRKTVMEIVAHPAYSSRTYDSDVALIRLSTPVELTKRVQKICLPDKLGISSLAIAEGKAGIVAGWGSNENDQSSEELSYVALPVVSADKCRSDTAFSIGDSGITGYLNANMFCAGVDGNKSEEEYHTVCPGDSGGPMVFQDSGDSLWRVQGIVSFYFGPKLCSFRKPGMYSVFTRVQGFIDWINYNAI